VTPAHDDLGDESLVAGLASGDGEAGRAFVRRFEPRVVGLALSMVGDRALAEDIAQEAFVRAWRHAPDYDARRGTVAGWVLTITRNLALDALRRRSRLVGDDRLAEAERAWTAAGGHDTDEAIDLRDALAALPEPQRRALLLAAVFGMTAAEVGAREGIPLGTAKTRIRQALLRLREAMVT
jgi:RNA polymerase sigma-70 factor (ECF subfamily)